MTRALTIKANTKKAYSLTKKARIILMNLELTDESKAKNLGAAENDQLNNEYDLIRSTKFRILKTKSLS